MTRVQKYEVIYILMKGIHGHCYHKVWHSITWVLHHQEEQKYDLQVGKYKRMLTSYKKGFSRASQKGQIENDLLLIRLLLKESLIFHKRVHLVPSFGIWTCRSKSYQKATQRVCKMKPSGVHRQPHMYKIKVTWAQSCKYGIVTQSEKNKLSQRMHSDY